MADPLVLWNIALASFGMALGVFFAAALLRQRSLQVANHFLAAFCFCFALLMAGDLLVAIFASKLTQPSNNWSGNVLDGVFLLLPPLFYFYVVTLISGALPSKFTATAAILPAIFCTAWFTVQLFLVPAPQNDATHEFMPAAYSLVFLLLAMGQLILYSSLIYQSVSAYVRKAKDNFSELKDVDLQWLKTLIFGVGIIALFWVLSVVINHPYWTAISLALPPLVLMFLGLWALQQAPLRQDAYTATGADSAESQPAPLKYAKSGLSQERMKELADQLESFMHQDKAFLEGDLTLNQLSSRIGVPQHQLSQVLNQHVGASFFEYINRLRVQEAKRCLVDSAFQGQTLLDIGLAAGFNSKAAFNAAFKRYSGLTPTEFRAKASKTGPKTKA
jgi:AraC-like DNA-binding protein